MLAKVGRTPIGAHAVRPYIYTRASVISQHSVGYNLRSHTDVMSWSALLRRIRWARSRVGSMFFFRFT